MIPGFHGVREAVRQGKTHVKEIWIAEGKTSSRAEEICQIADQKNIPVLIKKSIEISQLLPDTAHQGMVARVEPFSYTELTRLTDTQRKTPALLIVLDHITDEGNLGAIIRTAVFFGAHGLIIPKDRSAGITANVLKRSSGTCFHLPIVRVVNVGRALDTLKKKGFWIIGAAGDGPASIYGFDWNRDVALVLGSEQKGISQTVQKRCDEIVSIPGSGLAESLNVAVAGGVILSEIVRQRKAEKP